MDNDIGDEVTNGADQGHLLGNRYGLSRDVAWCGSKIDNLYTFERASLGVGQLQDLLCHLTKVVPFGRCSRAKIRQLALLSLNLSRE